MLRTPEDAKQPFLFRITPGNIKTVGRAPRADFVVDAALVSRVHCRFILSEENQLDVEDLGSTNGTYVNGHKIGKSTLNDGDKITVGRVAFRVNAESNAQRGGNPKTTWSS